MAIIIGSAETTLTSAVALLPIPFASRQRWMRHAASGTRKVGRKYRVLGRRGEKVLNVRGSKMKGKKENA